MKRDNDSEGVLGLVGEEDPSWKSKGLEDDSRDTRKEFFVLVVELMKGFGVVMLNW